MVGRLEGSLALRAYQLIKSGHGHVPEDALGVEAGVVELQGGREGRIWARWCQRPQQLGWLTGRGPNCAAEGIGRSVRAPGSSRW